MRDEMLFAFIWLACAAIVLSVMVVRLAKENDRLTLDLFLSELENDALYRKEFEDGDAG
jgi:hypothetical protein